MADSARTARTGTTAVAGAARRAADRADTGSAPTVTSHTAGTGYCRGVRPPQHDATEPRPPPHQAASTPATRRAEAGLAGEGRTAAGPIRGRAGPHGSALGRPPLGTASTPRGTTYPVDGGGGESRRDHGGTGPASSGAEPGDPEREKARSDGGGLQRRGPPPGRRAPPGAPAAISSPPRRQPTDTHVIQEQRDAVREQSHAPAARREAPAPDDGAWATAPRAPRAPRPPQAGSTAATTPRCRVRRSARRASYGANSRTSFSPADTTPTLFRLLVRRVPVLPRGLGRAQRAAASSALRTARGLPHLVGIVPALPPRQRHARAVRPPPLLRAHAGPPGLQLPIVRGARGHAPRRG